MLEIENLNEINKQNSRLIDNLINIIKDYKKSQLDLMPLKYEQLVLNKYKV